MPMRVAITSVRLTTKPGKAAVLGPNGQVMEKAVRPVTEMVKAGTPLNLTAEMAADLDRQGATALPSDERAQRFGFGPGSAERFQVTDKVVGAGADPEAQDTEALNAEREAALKAARDVSRPVEQPDNTGPWPAQAEADADVAERADAFQDETRVRVSKDDSAVVAKVDAMETHRDLDAFVEDQGLSVADNFKTLKVTEKKAAIKAALKSDSDLI